MYGLIFVIGLIAVMLVVCFLLPKGEGWDDPEID